MQQEASPALIARARSDPRAFGEVYDMYIQRVYAFCLSRARNRDEAEDLTAQTFERALAAIGRYEQRGAKFSGWLFRIAANAHLDRQAVRSREMPMAESESGETIEEPSADPSPDAYVQMWEEAAALRDHLSTLPDDQQRAVRLRYWHGYSLAETASELGRNENATKQLLHRAMTTLRQRVSRDGVLSER